MSRSSMQHWYKKVTARNSIFSTGLPYEVLLGTALAVQEFLFRKASVLCTKVACLLSVMLNPRTL